MYRSRALNILLGLTLPAIVVSGIYIQFLIDTTGVDLDAALAGPSLKNLTGTDELGRDVFLRTLEGASLSLRISVLAWVVSLIIGLAAGSFAGYYPNSFSDTLISGLISYAFATPFMVFLIAFLGVIGPGIGNAYFTLVLFAWAAPARQARVIVSGMKRTQFVIAAQSFGYSSKEMLSYVVIPQVFKPVLIASLAVLPEIIALDAALSFFGLGVQPPAPSLGKMIVDGINYLSVAWWMCLAPVFCLLGVCLIIRYLANHLTGLIYE